MGGGGDKANEEGRMLGVQEVEMERMSLRLVRQEGKATETNAELNGVIDRGREIEMRKSEREEEELMSDEARGERGEEQGRE